MGGTSSRKTASVARTTTGCVGQVLAPVAREYPDMHHCDYVKAN